MSLFHLAHIKHPPSSPREPLPRGQEPKQASGLVKHDIPGEKTP